MARTADRKLAIARAHPRPGGEKVRAVGRRTFSSTRWCCRSRRASRRTGATALETIEGVRRISRELPRVPDGGRAVERELRAQAGRARRAEQRLPARAARGRADRRHRARVEDPAAKPHRSDEQWNAALDLIYDRRRDGFDPLTALHSLFPDEDEPDAASAARSPRGPAARGAAQATHHRRRETRGAHCHSRRGDRSSTRRWTSSTTILLDGMKVVGDLFGCGPDAAPVRAAERRDDEGGGRLPRAAHGEGRGRVAARA